MIAGEITITVKPKTMVYETPPDPDLLVTQSAQTPGMVPEDVMSEISEMIMDEVQDKVKDGTQCIVMFLVSRVKDLPEGER